MAKWLRLTLIGAALLAAQPVCADWLDTRWGQSLDQVIATNPKAIRRMTTAESDLGNIADFGRPLATMEFKGPKFSAPAFFYFDDRGLVGIKLDFSKGADGLAAFDLLKLQYGMPVASAVNRRACESIDFQWQDTVRKNNIEFAYFTCRPDGTNATSNLLYSRVPTAQETGL